MKSSKLAGGILLLAAAVAVVLMPAAKAEAQDPTLFTRTYKVQVEYWFWDSEYYYWDTVFESADREEAEFVYALLLHAKSNGQLNSVAPNEYWKYIAVDVRMITVYKMRELRFKDYDLILRDP